MHRFDLDRIGAGLTVAGSRTELERAIATGAAIVVAPPGTGKTTFVPPLVAEVLAERAGRVLVTQPRRVAVRAAARRIAELGGTRLGGPIGFTVRGERIVSAETRIETVTPGVLLRRLLSDPGLDGVVAVVLDEVHERSVDGDLLLGVLNEVRALRDDLVLVAMSATLDTGPLAQLLGAVVVDVPSPLYPLDVAYAPSPVPRLGARGVTREYLDHLAAVAVAEQRSARQDALVFVPSARDVDEIVRRVRASDPEIEVLPLHGRLPAEAQDRAVSGRTAPTDPPRIVVSTALAESSLTVPGVRLVIDSGLSREARRDRSRDMAGLVTVSTSRASADQRAGRAARQGPGRVVRAYAEVDFAAFRAASEPEIRSADLTDAALLLAAWGAPEGRGLAMLTPPPTASIEHAVEVLRGLGLVDDHGRATRRGTRVSRMPVGAREARALLDADADPTSAAEAVAAISGDHRDPGADLDALVRALRSGTAPGAARWRGEVRRLARVAEQARSRDAEVPLARTVSAVPGLVAALANPAWIARRASDGSRVYLFASGTRAALPDGSGLIGSEWLAVCDVQRADGAIGAGTGAVIRLAAAISAADAHEIGGVVAVRETSIEGSRVRVRHERRVGAIVLSSTPVRPRRDDAEHAIAAHLREHGLGALTWPEHAAQLRARLGLIHRELGDPWPNVTDDALLDRLDDWLGGALQGASSLSALDLTTALKGLLPWPEAAQFDQLAPERFGVPSGASVRIEYPADPAGRPVVAVKLQEVFGLAETPRLVGARVPVQFHLLSPARRPLAVTEDLASFWNGPYQEVRKQMRGRYPKHPWPEDPWRATATARTTKRMPRE